MDMSFDVQTQGLYGFDSFLPENIGGFWNSVPGAGVEDLLAFDTIIDSKKSDLGKSPANSGKKNSSETKNVAALKSHCEAERRRRERINSHLANLRNFVPCTDKMDKATLLAEVISQVKELKKQAKEATKGLLVPTDADEVVVVPYDDYDAPDDVFVFRASVCSDYKPELIPDLRRAIDKLNLTIAKAEISTLGSRVKTVFTVTGRKDLIGYDRRGKFSKAINKAMNSVLEKISASEEYSPRSMYPNKRRKTSPLFDSSSSSPSL